MWKIILLVFVSINNSIKAINPKSNKVVKLKIDNIGKKVRNLLKAKNMTKSQKFPNAKANKASGICFLTFKAKVLFTKLRKVFTKTIIFWCFNVKCHIEIETHILDSFISKLVSQIIFN